LGIGSTAERCDGGIPEAGSNRRRAPPTHTPGALAKPGSLVGCGTMSMATGTSASPDETRHPNTKVQDTRTLSIAAHMGFGVCRHIEVAIPKRPKRVNGHIHDRRQRTDTTCLTAAL